MNDIIDVENIKCGGCANSIETRLKKIDTVTQVSVDVGQGRVTVEAGDDSRAQLVAALLASGYPEKGTTEGIKAATAKAKSYVSCAIGKIS